MACSITYGCASRTPASADARARPKRSSSGLHAASAPGLQTAPALVAHPSSRRSGGKSFGNLNKTEFDVVWQQLSDLGLDNPT